MWTCTESTDAMQETAEQSTGKIEQSSCVGCGTDCMSSFTHTRLLPKRCKEECYSKLRRTRTMARDVQERCMYVEALQKRELRS